MQVDELDVIELKDGRSGTVLETFGDPVEAYLIEISDTNEIETIETDLIKKVSWRLKDH